MAQNERWQLDTSDCGTGTFTLSWKPNEEDNQDSDPINTPLSITELESIVEPWLAGIDAGATLTIFAEEDDDMRPIFEFGGTFAQLDLEEHFAVAPLLGCHDNETEGSPTFTRIQIGNNDPDPEPEAQPPEKPVGGRVSSPPPTGAATRHDPRGGRIPTDHRSGGTGYNPNTGRIS